MAQPAQQPPQPRRRQHATHVVVSHDLRVVINAPRTQLLRQTLRIGQWMPPRGRRDGIGQIFVQMSVMGAGKVAVAIGPAAGLGIGQTEAAIDHDPVRVVAVSVQRAGIDESGMAHGFRSAGCRISGEGG